MTLHCDDLDALIDLYAAGELSREEQAAARQHLAGCARCTEQLDAAREALALVDLHFRQPAALKRLHQAMRREAAPRSRGLGLAQRLAPLAALLLVALGLALLLPPAPTTAPVLAALPAELAFVPEAAHEVVPSRGKPDRVAVKKMALERDTVEAIQVARGAKKAVPIALVVTLHNPDDRPLVVELGGRAFALRIDSAGAPLERQSAPGAAPPVPGPRPVTLPPGGKHVLELNRLAEQAAGEVTLLFPTSAGDHRLSVEVRARAWPAGAPRAARQRTWRGGTAILSLPAPKRP